VPKPPHSCCCCGPCHRPLDNDSMACCARQHVADVAARQTGCCCVSSCACARTCTCIDVHVHVHVCPASPACGLAVLLLSSSKLISSSASIRSEPNSDTSSSSSSDSSSGSSSSSNSSSSSSSSRGRSVRVGRYKGEVASDRVRLRHQRFMGWTGVTYPPLYRERGVYGHKAGGLWDGAIHMKSGFCDPSMLLFLRCVVHAPLLPVGPTASVGPCRGAAMPNLHNLHGPCGMLAPYCDSVHHSPRHPTPSPDTHQTITCCTTTNCGILNQQHRPVCCLLPNSTIPHMVPSARVESTLPAAGLSTRGFSLFKPPTTPCCCCSPGATVDSLGLDDTAGARPALRGGGRGGEGAEGEEGVQQDSRGAEKNVLRERGYGTSRLRYE